MEEIAQVYARALFEVAVEHDALDEIREQLDQFTDALDQNRQLAAFFFSPYFSATEKKDGLAHAVTEANPAFENFLQALIERHRMPAIFRIRTEFVVLWDKERKLLPVQITSAIELDSDTIEKPGQADWRTGRSNGRDVVHGRPGHSRWDCAPGGERDPRLLDQEPFGTTSKASRPGVVPRLSREL